MFLTMTLFYMVGLSPIQGLKVHPKPHDHQQMLELLVKHHLDAVPEPEIEDCTAVGFGLSELRHLSFPSIHLPANLTTGLSRLDLGNCFFIITTFEQILGPMLDKLIEVPIFIMRLPTGQPPKLEFLTAAERRIPSVYLAEDGQRFVYMSHCREPRMGVRSKLHGGLYFKTPETRTDCLFRVGYNTVKSVFEMMSNGKPDTKTKEGAPLQAFIEREQLRGVFRNGNNRWGKRDPETDTWDGLVNLAMNDLIDVGVSYISYTLERNQVIGYSNFIYFQSNYLITKYPGLASPAGNLFRVFDTLSWASILVCTLVPCLFVYSIMRFVDNREERFDFIEVLMHANFINTTFPDRYIKKANMTKQSLTILLGILLMASTVLAKAFGCNLSAILMKPVGSAPVDSTCDVLERNMGFVFMTSTFQADFFRSSSGPCHKESIAALQIDYKENHEECFYSLITNPNKVMMDGKEPMLGTAVRNPKFEAYPKPWFYFSKELILPYYMGWVLIKKSVWEERLNRHLQQCDQAGIGVRIDRLYEQFGEDFQVSMQPIRLEHILIGVYILCFGYVLSFTVFVIEILRRKYRGNGNVERDVYFKFNKNRKNVQKLK